MTFTSLEIFLMGVLVTNFGWMGRHGMMRLGRRLKARSQPELPQVFILGSEDNHQLEPVTELWRGQDLSLQQSADDDTQHQPVIVPEQESLNLIPSRQAAAEEEQLPSLLEIMTDQRRFANQEIIIPARISVSNYYNYGYREIAKTHFCFSISYQGEQRFFFEKGYVYMARGPAADDLRLKLFRASDKALNLFIKLYIHADRIEANENQDLTAELLAVGETTEELRHTQQQLTLKQKAQAQERATARVRPVKKIKIQRQPMVTVQKTELPLPFNAPLNKKEGFSIHRPAFPTLLHIRTDLTPYADQEVLLPARLWVGAFFPSAHPGLEQSYYCIGLTDETDSGYFYLLKSPAADKLRDELILSPKDAISFVKIIPTTYLNEGFRMNLHGELLAVGESSDQMQTLTPARTLFERPLIDATSRTQVPDPNSLFTDLTIDDEF